MVEVRFKAMLLIVIGDFLSFKAPVRAHAQSAMDLIHDIVWATYDISDQPRYSVWLNREQQ